MGAGMTDAELASRGHRAALCDEFLAPMLAEVRDEHQRRIADIAVTELSPAKRSEKVTALAIGLKVIRNLEAGLKNAIETGKLAQNNIARAGEIEKLGREKRRLLDMLPTV